MTTAALLSPAAFNLLKASVVPDQTLHNTTYAIDIFDLITDISEEENKTDNYWVKEIRFTKANQQLDSKSKRFFAL